MNGQNVVTYDQAIAEAVEFLRQAENARISGERWGPNTTLGDTGLPVHALAAQFTAEAHAWATVAYAIATHRGGSS